MGGGGGEEGGNSGMGDERFRNQSDTVMSRYEKKKLSNLMKKQFSFIKLYVKI